MSNKIFLTLPTGNEIFYDVITKNRYYVDKTPYLKTVFSEEIPADGKTFVDGSSVLLFTRPRRFGKTLLMDMFETFLKVDSDNPGDTTLHNQLFHGTKITEDKAFCEKYMGKFPVIFITLKNVFGDDVEAAYSKLAEVVASKALEFSFLKDSTALDEDDRDTYAKISSSDYLKNADTKAKSYTTSAIKSLALMLYKHFGKQVYILIDEYDVPLAKAQENGYHKEMVNLISSFLDFLKTPSKDPKKGNSIIGKVIMTGCLKVAKNSIFTGVNNLVVNTVTSQNMNLTGIIGFTKDETLKALKDYEMDEYATLVKEHYDGYRFCDKEMFCPWDVVNFIEKNYENNLNGYKELVKADNYWATTTSGHAVYEYLGYLTDTDTQKMQDLIDGKTISFSLNDSMNYDCLSEHNPDDFWSLLLHTGYLTLDWDKTTEELKKDSNLDKVVFARIPNLKIRECFENNIQKRFNTEIVTGSVADSLANTLFEGNADTASDTIFDLLQNYISIRDSATKAPHENYYHGFLNGIFANCKSSISGYHSNIESGDGYADIIFKSKREDKVVIIEIKTCSGNESKKAKAREALSQIEANNYAKPYLDDEDVSLVYAYGISFIRKDCDITVKRLK